MNNYKNKFILAITSLFLLLTNLVMTNPVLAATSVKKGGFISGGAIETVYRPSPSWVWRLSVGMNAITVNGETAYCLEPARTLETNSATSVSLSDLTSINVGSASRPDAPKVILTASMKNKIILIANYGYGYPGHNTIKYQWATQILIWDALGFDTSGGTNVNTEKNNIMKLVDNHSTKPSWNKSLQKVKAGETVTLAGANDFEVITSQSKGVSVTTSGNNFNVKVNNPENATFVVRKKQGIGNGNSLVWSDGTSQKVMVAKMADPITAYIDFSPKYGDVELTKKDTNGNLVSNTTFELSTNKSSIIGTYTTGSNGKVSVKDLEEGTYYIREKSVPSPLIIDTSWKEVKVTAGKTASFTATNKIAQGKIEITKYGSNDLTGLKEKTIEGATFNIVSSSGAVVDTLTTGKDGKASSKNLPLGNYTVVETYVPEPLVLDKTPIEANIKYKDQTTEVILRELSQTNIEAVGQISITKFGYNTVGAVPRSNGDYLVVGAKFDVKDKDGKTVDRLTTDTNGHALSKKLPLGKYTVHETFVPEPLILDETPIEANIKYKDQTTAIVLREVTQRNKEAVGKIKVTKKSIHGDLIENTLFEIRDKDNTLVEELITDTDGVAISNDLKLGKYQLIETRVPENLVLDKTPIDVNINYKDQVTDVVLEAVEKTNDYQRSDLILNKIENNWDKLQPEYNGIRLSGATLELYAKEDIKEGSKLIYRSGELIGKEVTDKHGQVKFHNLPIGEYYAKETIAPEGYILFDGVWNISIKYDKENVETSITNTESTLENQIAYGRSKIHKTGKGGAEFLEGAVFGLFTKDGKKLGEFTTDHKGEIFSPELRFGSYYWQELKAPHKYFLDNTKHHFDITVDDHEEIIHIPLVNEFIEIKLQVNKKDAETDQPLAEAIFEIRDENDEVVTFDYVDDNFEVQTQSQLVTNDKGIALTQGFLKYGKYTLVEVQAPKGYLRNKPMPFEINEKTYFIDFPVIGKTKVQGISNQPTTTEVIKLSENTDEPLEGAYLRLIHKPSKEVILEWTSDGTPVVFKGLHIDETYVLEEVSAPLGYFVAESIEFTVKETSETQTITMLDELIPEIETQAFFENEDKVNFPSEEMSVIDTVPYKDLVVGKKYTLKGKLLDTENEEVIAEASLTFTPEKADGTVNLTFTFDGSKLLGKTLVIFEDLYRDERKVATHSEITDKKQTVYIPKIQTSASTSTYDKNSNETICIHDLITYNSLEVGREYTASGWLMTKDNKPLIDHKGNRIEASTTFIPSESNGTVEVIFEVPLEVLSKGDFVVFEELYLDNKLIAQHKDIEDDKQTISMIEIAIEKRDKKSKDLLEGVEFTLIDEHGEKIKTGLTDQYGLVRFLVPKGKYSIKETKALEGYIINQKEVKFKVKGTEKEHQILNRLTNKKVPELPKTGEGIGYLEIGAVLIGTSVILAIYNYLKGKEEKTDV